MDKQGELKKHYEIKSLPRRLHRRALYYIHARADSRLILEKVVF